MYKVTVKTRGKYNNVVPGARYCFTKRSAIDLAVTFANVECEFDVEKWTRLNKDIFCWSDSKVSEAFWDKFYKIVEKEQEEGA